MSFEFIVSGLWQRIRHFTEAKDGGVAIVFGLIAVPLICATGAAIDYSRAAVDRTAMQAALDATALAVSKDASSLSNSALTAEATSYFKAAFHRNDANDVQVQATFSNTNGDTLTLKSSASVSTYFMGILGIKSVQIGTSTTTAWGMHRLRVALVLDNTGSMAQDGKMTALKSATNNLLSQLQSAATQDGDVYVSIVPFVKDVNLGASNYNASWIDWTDWNANNGTCSGGNGGWGWSWGSGNTQSTCSGTWTQANHNTWNGCVVDRGDSTGPSTGNYDTNVVAPTTSVTATLFAAEQYSSCPQAALGLSYNWAAMNTLVNNMQPKGNTNQAIGLDVGWMSLAGGGPFTVPPEDSDYTYQKVIVLLTDGLNTQDRWYVNASQIDARQERTCDNIKASGITIYTIQVNTGTDPQSSVLQYCASDSSKFFYLTSSSQIAGVFSAIGTELSKLRIQK